MPAFAKPDAALRRAHALFLARRNGDALPRAHGVVEETPDRADAWTLPGILQQRAGPPRAAEAAYRQAVPLKADDADARTNLRHVPRDRDDRDGALLAFQQALRAAPRSPEPAYDPGLAREQFGQ